MAATTFFSFLTSVVDVVEGLARQMAGMPLPKSISKEQFKEVVPGVVAACEKIFSTAIQDVAKKLDVAPPPRQKKYVFQDGN